MSELARIEEERPDGIARHALPDVPDEPVMHVCEVCGGAGDPVAVSETRYGVVVKGQPTGYEEVAVACEKHRGAVLDALTAHVRATLDEQIPYHQMHHAKRADLERFVRRVQETARPLLDFHAEAVAMATGRRAAGEAFPIAAPSEELLRPHKEAVAAHDQAERERRDVLAAATAKHDERVAAFRAGLKG